MPSKTSKRSRVRRGLAELKVYATNGRWIAPIRVPGVARPLRIYGATEEQAYANRAAYQLEIAQGVRDSGGATSTFSGSRTPSLADWLGHWLEHVVQPVYSASGERLKGKQPTTAANYTWHVTKNILPYAIARVKLVDLRTSHVEEWYAQLLKKGTGPTTAYDARRVLVTALNYALDRRQETRVTHNPALAFKLRKAAPKEKPAPDPAVVTAILDAARGERLELIVHLGLFLGLRRQEMAALQARDFDLLKGELLIRRRVNRIAGRGILPRRGPKMGDDEEVQSLPIDVAVWAPLLQAHRTRQLEWFASNRGVWRGLDPRDEQAWLFTNRFGEVLDPNLIYRWLKGVFAQAGCPDKTVHGLRHDYAGILADSGADLLEISRALRHANTAVTDQVYTRLTKQHTRTVVGMAAEWAAQARAAGESTG